MPRVSPEVTDIIRGKKNRYCRSVDGKDWPLFDSVALPDAKFAFRYPDGTVITAALEGQDTSVPYLFDSRDEFKAFFEKTFEPLQTIHIVDSGDFEYVSDDEVKVFFVIITHAGPAGSKTGPGHATAGGNYHETWKRVGDDWLMSKLDFVGLYHKT